MNNEPDITSAARAAVQFIIGDLVITEAALEPPITREEVQNLIAAKERKHGAKEVPIGTRVKSVGYAYPNSPDAARFGFSSSGCFTVSAGEHGRPLLAVAGAETEADAHRFAAQKRFADLPYSQCSLRPWPGEDTATVPIPGAADTEEPNPEDDTDTRHDDLQWLAGLIDQRGPVCSWTEGLQQELDPDAMYTLSLTGAELAKIRAMIDA